MLSNVSLQHFVRHWEPSALCIPKVLALPLPSHPITYAPPPPARISFCEPVSQGLLMPTTKIVLVQAQPQGLRAQQTVPSRSAFLKQVAEDEADDTSNEQFYSAAEDKPGESGTEMVVISRLAVELSNGK
ncbi:hypothetical protein VN97_g12999 [Penicillium thymicola]|uniref:Uncharacterized protein n=1 Tax=Penicillium thymicola TaxID=293382 RepID=A0AAI9T4J9_PENTH|nr:hypothetical protein VN97_g12999 [Penicillium thymicola]